MPASRALRTTLRVAHIVAVAALYGGHVYGVPREELTPALLASVGTGVAFMGFEIVRSPVWLLQVRGSVTLLKIALVASVGVLWELRVPLLTTALVLGTVTSHLPGRFRYHSLFHGRVIGPEEKG